MLWIGIDIDGTIINNDNKVISGAKEAINKLYDTGNRVSICSARGYIALKHGISLDEEKQHIEKLLDKANIKYTEIYFGIKPACDIWIDDRTITKEPQLSWKEILNRLIPKQGLVFVMLTGFPGAGKTTLLKKRFSENYICISRDSLIGMFKLGNSNETKIIAKRMEIEGIKAAFENGESVAIDKLNLNRKNRSLYINLAKKYNATIVCFYLNSDPKDAWEQNIQREPEKIVKEEKFNSIIKRFQPPSEDEGFDYLIELNKNNREDYDGSIEKIIKIENEKGLVEALKLDKEISEKNIKTAIKECHDEEKIRKIMKKIIIGKITNEILNNILII